jgi:hypothetical protein
MTTVALVVCISGAGSSYRAKSINVRIAKLCDAKENKKRLRICDSEIITAMEALRDLQVLIQKEEEG